MNACCAVWPKMAHVVAINEIAIANEAARRFFIIRYLADASPLFQVEFGFVGLTIFQKRLPQKTLRIGIPRLNSQRFLVFRDRFGQSPEAMKSDGEIIMRERARRRHAQSVLIMREGFFAPARLKQEIT